MLSVLGVAEDKAAVRLALLCSQNTSGVVLIGSDLQKSSHDLSSSPFLSANLAARSMLK